MDNPANYVWILIPLGGLAVGAFAIYQGAQSRRAAIEVLKTYAQQGKEPPPEILDAVAGIAADSSGDLQRIRTLRDPRLRRASYFSRFILLGFLAAGFAGIGAWMEWGHGAYDGFPFFIAAFVLAAVSASSLVWALMTPRDGGRDGL